MEDNKRCGCGPGLKVDLGGVALPSLRVNGEVVTAKVSSAGVVYAGDFVQRVDELEEVDELRFLAGGKVLAACRNGQGRCAVLYAQEGKSYLKAVAYNGKAVALGNSVQVAEETLEGAALVCVDESAVAVVYNSEGAGLAGLVRFDDRVGELAYTDLWDDGDPYNIAVSKSDTGKVLVSCLHHQADGSGRAVVKVVAFGETCVTPGPETALETEYDDDEYAGGWSVAALSPHVGVVSFFRAHAKPVAFAVLDIGQGDKVAVRYVGECVYVGSLPCTSVMAINEQNWMFANGIARVDASGQVVKSMLACEVWHTTQYGALPSWYSVDDQEYDANLGRVAVDAMRPAACLSYTIDNVARAMLIDIGDNALRGYPGVQVGPFDGFSQVVPLNATYAAMVHQRGGNGYAKILKRVPTALTSDTVVNGLARTGGGPGEKITIISTQRHTK